jgi:hypothetical protein
MKWFRHLVQLKANQIASHALHSNRCTKLLSTDKELELMNSQLSNGTSTTIIEPEVQKEAEYIASRNKKLAILIFFRLDSLLFFTGDKKRHTLSSL